MSESLKARKVWTLERRVVHFDLHTESGIAALRECGLYDEFVKLARFDGEGHSVL